MSRRGRHHELEARFGSAQFQQLIELLADRTGGAVFVVDARNSVLFWSRSAEREFGRPASEVVAQHCLMAVSSSACLARCALAAGDAPHEARVRRADGRIARYRRYVFPMLADDGSYEGGVELLVPLSALPVERATGEVVRFGALTSSDPAGIAALDRLQRLAATSGPWCVVSDEAGARWEIARALHAARGRSGLPTPIRGRPPPDGLTPDRTWFVDELHEADAELQHQLVAALRPGGPLVVVGLRRPIRAEVRSGLVRADLGAVLAACEVVWPSLRDRPEDVRRVALEVIDHWNATGPHVRAVDEAAMQRLVRWVWLGGEAELRIAVEQACAVCDGVVRDEHLPPSLSLPPIGADAPGAEVGSAEARRIRDALAEADGNLSAAAARLGVSRTTLYRKRKLLGL